ncbi:MAG TPA: hypothetical protein VKA91_08940 [Nitrososphaeraceae archaeon]|nr:hypothetical protein [Nitrososphaeraceae archaeon]
MPSIGLKHFTIWNLLSNNIAKRRSTILQKYRWPQFDDNNNNNNNNINDGVVNISINISYGIIAI